MFPARLTLMAVITGLALELLSIYPQHHYLSSLATRRRGWSVREVSPIYVLALGTNGVSNTIGYVTVVVPIIAIVVDTLFANVLPSAENSVAPMTWLGLIGLVWHIQTRPEGILVDG